VIIFGEGKDPGRDVDNLIGAGRGKPSFPFCLPEISSFIASSIESLSASSPFSTTSTNDLVLNLISGLDLIMCTPTSSDCAGIPSAGASAARRDQAGRADAVEVAEPGVETGL
jgi:hypothetical protein